QYRPQRTQQARRARRRHAYALPALLAPAGLARKSVVDGVPAVAAWAEKINHPAPLPGAASAPCQPIAAVLVLLPPGGASLTGPPRGGCAAVRRPFATGRWLRCPAARQ